MSFNYSPKIVTNGLVLCLDAANPNSYPGSGTTWYDISQGGNNGILTNGPTFSTERGGCLVFDGTDDFVDFNNQPLFNLDNITLEVVVSLSAIPVSVNYVARNRVNGYGISFPTSGSTSYSVTTYVDAATSYTYNSSPVTVGTPYVLSFTFGSSTFSTYENGNQTYTVAAASGSLYYGATPQTNIFRLSRDGGSGTGKFLNGKIYTARVYNRALSAQEISQNYNALKNRFGL